MPGFTGKDVFGYLLLIIIGLFGAALIWAHVSIDTSHGLQELIAILAVVAGAFMNMYVGERKAKDGEAK